jgi:hypothetical protein
MRTIVILTAIILAIALTTAWSMSMLPSPGMWRHLPTNVPGRFGAESSLRNIFALGADSLSQSAKMDFSLELAGDCSIL